MIFKPVALPALGACLVNLLASGASGEGFGSWFDLAPISRPYEDNPAGYGVYVYPRFTPSRRLAHKRTHAKRVLGGHKAFVAVDKSGLPTQWSEMTARLAAMQNETPGAIGIFLGDTSLRKGDAIMTNAGLRVFWGSSAPKEHSIRDFIALSSAKAEPHRSELAAIQKVSAPPFEVAHRIETASFVRMQHASIEFATSEPKAIRQIPGIQ